MLPSSRFFAYLHLTTVIKIKQTTTGIGEKKHLFKYMYNPVYIFPYFT